MNPELMISWLDVVFNGKIKFFHVYIMNTVIWTWTISHGFGIALLHNNNNNDNNSSNIYVMKIMLHPYVVTCVA